MNWYSAEIQVQQRKAETARQADRARTERKHVGHSLWRRLSPEAG